MSNKKKAAVAGIALTLAAAGISIWQYYLVEQPIESLTLYGNVDIREVELAFRVPGRLAEMDFDEGDTVAAGQRVARIDPEPYMEALAVAEARVEQARANLDKLQAGVRPQELQRARDGVAAAQALFDNAQRDFERQNGLLASGASSQRIVDAARAQRDEARASLSSAREALALAEEGFRAEDVSAARADLAAAEAQREQLQTQLDDTELSAPSPGTLLARVREPGSMLAAGAPVYTLSLSDPIYVRAYVAEPNLGDVAPGTAVTLTTDSSAKTYHGQIGFVAPRAEFTPKTVQTTDLRTDLVFRLRIVVDDADDMLRQGMPVTISVPLRNGTD